MFFSQDFSIDPFYVLLFMQRQMDCLRSVKDHLDSPIIFHVDATGSILRGGPSIYLYSICVQINIRGVKCLPLFEFLSKKHDNEFISMQINKWIQTFGKNFVWPHVIVTDFSWALLHAVATAFLKSSIRIVLVDQWVALYSDLEINCIIRLCSNHLIHAISRRLRPMSLNKEVVDFILW